MFSSGDVAKIPRRSGRATTQPRRLSQTSPITKNPSTQKRLITSTSTSGRITEKKRAKLTHSPGIDDNEKDAFIQELRKRGINESKLKIINDFLLNTSYSIAHSRSLTNDFMKIIANEAGSKAKIYSNIGTHCRKNLTMNPICFCCGEPIMDEKACDHVIPIITMLMTVTADSVPHNLHYIHKRCNTIKSNKNILEVFNQIGRKDGIFNCSIDNTTICQSLFVNILKLITFRNELDIKHRLDQIKPFNTEVRNLIDKFELYYNDIKVAANILIGISRAYTAPALAKGKKLTQRKKVLLHNPNITRKISRKPRGNKN